MKRPLIGITCSFEVGGAPLRARNYLAADYADAVYAAGGLPVPIPPPPEPSAELLDAWLDCCDAVVFSGGPDLDPRHYSQPRHERTEVMHQRRDAFDLPLFRRLDERRRPVLAICLGCQIANVSAGGKLVQHVDDLPASTRVQHHMPDHSSAFHDVRLEPDSRLAQITGATRFEVNSRHHQVVDVGHVAARFRPVAFAPDGTIEALEDRSGRFIIAVQWHPENLIDRPEHLRLFQALVEEARRCAASAAPGALVTNG